ncbi:hypothetical protein GW901_00460 [Candidatus Parcubacteria bacterium]|nr:hypothetical protein [Candidatus Parcubacteria bacterium]
MKRFSTKTNVKPQKVYIKDIDNWKGESVGIVLLKNDALLLAEGLIKTSQKAKKIDITIFPKAKTPVITVTYLR